MVDADEDRERLLTALREQAPLLTNRITQQIGAIEPSDAPLAAAVENDIAAQVREMLAAGSGTGIGTGPSAPTTAEGDQHLRQFLGRVLRAGVPVDLVMRGLRIALDEGMSLTDELGSQLGISSSVRSSIGRQFLAWSDLAMTSASESYRNTVEPIPERMRRFAPLLSRVRNGESPTTEELTDLRHGGVDAGATYYAVIAHIDADSSEVAHTIKELLNGHGGIVAYRDGELLGLVRELPARISGVTAGAGPRADLADAATSFRLAERALLTATTFGLEGIHTFDDLGLYVAVVEDRDVGAALVRRYIDPCLAAPSGTELIATVSVYLALGANVAATATRLSIHENTLRYRRARYVQLTGSSLRETRTRAEVWWATSRRE